MGTNKHISVERPVACAGKGQYLALVQYGLPGGEVCRSVFEYSRKDPRYKGDAAVLQDITRAMPARYRSYILAISIIKRCLHPKSAQVARADRTAHFERVFSWVVEHGNTVRQSPQAARRRHFSRLLDGQRVHSVELPYTPFELQQLPLTAIATTNFWPAAYASIGLRGIERRVGLRHLVLASLLGQ